VLNAFRIFDFGHLLSISMINMIIDGDGRSTVADLEGG
jgi:hypothetical protein